MAHRGKIYPLAFRRDYNLNVRTYELGLGDQYICRISTGPFGTAGRWNNVQFHVYANRDVDPADNKLIWNAVPPHAGFTYFELAIEVDPVTFIPLARARLYSPYPKLLVEWRPHSDSQRTSSFQQDDGRKVLYNDPIDFIPTTNIERSDIFVLDYTGHTIPGYG